MHEAFWAAIAKQLKELESAQNAADVLRILAVEGTTARGFFAGSGGDDTVQEALVPAGWTLHWAESSVYSRCAPPTIR